ncbi:hypothetical protein BDV95DRAFT_185746 [Massariosphaeria phaeospora]|uniref:SET domain-containing protein n=1 Tax=Massariosphaeria phaeospora TaxID=100035 RepID=A0A7C8I8Q2_9PLEO|nr:hypothetical protein BDV95DRAFT_185746 [Massariosphaeria phaeospora]
MAGRNTSPTSIASTLSNITVPTNQPSEARSFHSASPPMSTPPTSLGDETSILSDTTKMDQMLQVQEEVSTPHVPPQAQPAPPSTPAVPSSESRRPARSSRKSVTTYNVQILAGTAIHTPTKYLQKHHGNVLHGPINSVRQKHTATPPKKRTPRLKRESVDSDDAAEAQLATEAAQAAQRRTSARFDLRKEVLRNSTVVGEPESSGRDTSQTTLRRSASDSRLGRSSQSRLPSPKRPRTSKDAELAGAADTEEEEDIKPKKKQWMNQGLYVGQDRDFDARLSESQNRAKKRASKKGEGTVLPLPMFAGERMLDAEVKTAFRNFRLPFDTYHPLPRKVKVDGWVKLHKNRFIGEASALWKRDKQDSSQCYCTPEDGCGEACHNRIMAYECDSTNCRLPADECGNRPFAQLKQRSKGNGYDYGVEVLETEDRGFGVRAMRTFEPHQIIVEYAGEIITQNECERRMKQVYKKDKCYYLMSFDNKMIIDATRGTIARFVNHSCEPNCEMIKWTVSGEPRMALFAGSRGIMTGDELTYDYNFDPFSSKNIQECRCGAKNCRGVLGPKPKKPPLQEEKPTTSLLAGAKRKFQEVFGSGKRSESAPNSPKKRKGVPYMANSALTKLQNAQAETTAVRQKAEQEAARAAAQKNDRKNRLMQRGASTVTITSRRSAVVRRGTRAYTPNLTSTRKTTVNLKRSAPPKPGALKSIKKSLLKRASASASAKRGIPPNPKREADTTPDRDMLPSDSEQVSASDADDDDDDDDDDSMAFPDSDDEYNDEQQEREQELAREFAAVKASAKKRGAGAAMGAMAAAAAAARGLQKTGAGVKKGFARFRR